MLKTATILTFALVFFVANDLATADRGTWEPRAEIAKGPAADAAAPMDWLNRNVRGTGDIVVGRVSDVVLSPVTGRITGLIVGVGAALGTGEKDVAIPIDAVEVADRSNRSYLVIQASRQSLQSADAVRFDGATSQWVTVGAPSL